MGLRRCIVQVFVSFHFVPVFVFAGVFNRPDISAAVMVLFTLMSWKLRPPDRRLPEGVPVGETGALSWIVLGVILGLMLILSLFLLPKGTPR
jgi:hypothetical protein